MSDLKPGRSLDALVAEKVMNLPRYGVDTTSLSGSDLFPPEYSTDISAAWEVVEKLKELTLGDFRLTSLFMNGHRYCAHFVDPNDKHTSMRFGDTAPHAICLAALKAVGGLNE